MKFSGMSAEKKKLFESVRKLLTEEFQRVKEKSPKFSMRSFAKKLDVSQAEISEVINGKRNPSSRLIVRLYTMLGKRHPQYLEEAKKLSSLGIRKKKRDKNLLKIEEEQFKLISDWHNFALLSLLETADFKSDISWIAERLNVSVEKVEQSITLLQHLKLIVRDSDDQLTLTNEGVKTPDNILSAAVRESHINDLALADKALKSSIPVDLRDFTSCSYAVNVKNIPKLKAMVRKFQDQVALLLEDDQASEVYRMSIYFYPLTQLHKINDDKN